ncbi:MAG TPA: histidine phosphatase family protein [Pseudonocardiaceae bacterium]|nr:histidine phosphatase family protein [Pseudonocardiaceae bacterium]
MTLTRRLILLRHAKSAWPADIPDARRPLAERGRRDAPAVGRWLRAHIATIDRVVCSPAVRAVQTWDLAAAQLATTPPACLDERLYGASAAVLLAVTHKLAPDASTAVLVGHNPGLEDFLTLLTGAVEPLKTSSLAVISVPDSWAATSPDSAALETLATPRG